MRVQTMREVGAAVRAARRAQGLTQADLAARLRVSRDWVVRLEQGSPRLEAQRVLDAVTLLGLTLDIGGAAAPSTTAADEAGVASPDRHAAAAHNRPDQSDPFAFLHERTS